MRYLAIGFLALLAGCNNGSNGISSSDFTAALAAVTHEDAIKIASLEASVTSQQTSINKLQLIGNAHGIVRADRALAIGNHAAQAEAIDFGSCLDMGVLIGRGISNVTNDPLAAPTESFQQCTGYDYTVDMLTFRLADAPRLFWANSDCTGDMMEFPGQSASYNAQTLTQGVVFLSPADDSTQLVVVSGQTPTLKHFQSVWVLSNPGCQPDDEIQIMYSVRAVTAQDSFGVPIIFGQFQLKSP